MHPFWPRSANEIVASAILAEVTALSVILAVSGMNDQALALSPIVANPEARALLRFAVSDAYDDLAAAMEA